ncbi:MAG: DUF493 domain-containing protein [Gammaproteobacteria bacterium]
MSEDLLTFPLEFPVKVMGRSAPDFVELVTGIVSDHTGALAEEAVAVRDSRKGNFVSVTVTFTATSREQLDAVYRALSGHERVLMVL